MEFWSTMWATKKDQAPEKGYKKYLYGYHSGAISPSKFFTFKEFQKIMNCLPNWKTAAPDGIYNLFIKKCNSIYNQLYELLERICFEDKEEKSSVYKGINYLIPKGSPTKDSDFTPIICMSSLHKLIIKSVTKVIQLSIDQQKLLT
ncbi:hypothetical protein NUSPORA_01580 [Nucleospora cyclopteri]